MSAVGTPAPAETEWELVVKPVRMRIYAGVAAAALVIAFAVFAALLRIEETGVNYRVDDQVAVALVGVFLACGPLLLMRPRLRAGRRGVTVRNAFSERLYEWDLVRGLTFPEGAAWARLELEADEYQPVLAVQINDRMHAVAAVRTFREIAARYAPAAPAPSAEDDGPAAD